MIAECCHLRNFISRRYGTALVRFFNKSKRKEHESRIILKKTKIEKRVENISRAMNEVVKRFLFAKIHCSGLFCGILVNFGVGHFG